MSTPGSSSDTHRTRRQSEALLELTQAVANAGSLEEALDVLLEITATEIEADRTTIFLNDEATEQLFSRRAMGGLSGEIRIPNNSGIAGYVFSTGEAVIIDDVYEDPRFNQAVDQETGYKTKSLLCVAIRDRTGRAVGAAQALNCRKGTFDQQDRDYLEKMAARAATMLRQAQYAERVDPPFLKSLRRFGRWLFGGPANHKGA